MRSRRWVVIALGLAALIVAVAYRVASHSHKEDDSMRVLAVGLGAAAAAIGLVRLWASPRESGPIAPRAFATVGFALAFAALAWSWLTERSLRSWIAGALRADVHTLAQQRFEDEALWLVPMADAAMRRTPDSGEVDASLPSTDAAFAAWLASEPPPRGVMSTPRPGSGAEVELVPAAVDKEPWRSLGLPSLGEHRMRLPPTVLGQFRYAHDATGRALLAFVGDPHGSGETVVRWIEIRRRDDGKLERSALSHQVLPRP